MYCLNCGNQIKEGDDFCINCGAKVVYPGAEHEAKHAPLPQNAGVSKPTSMMEASSVSKSSIGSKVTADERSKMWPVRIAATAVECVACLILLFLQFNEYLLIAIIVLNILQLMIKKRAISIVINIVIVFITIPPTVSGGGGEFFLLTVLAAVELLLTIMGNTSKQN